MSKGNGKSLLLHNARLVLPDRTVEHGAVLIENERIALITPASTRLGNQEQIDLQGLTLFPGFIDVHIHGAVGVDTMDAEPKDLERVSQFLATRGVTGWLPTLVPASTADYARSIKAITESMKEQERAEGRRSQRGARILGVHYEGPFVNSAQCGALRARFFRSFSGASDLTDLPVLDQQTRQTHDHRRAGDRGRCRACARVEPPRLDCLYRAYAGRLRSA